MSKSTVYLTNSEGVYFAINSTIDTTKLVNCKLFSKSNIIDYVIGRDCSADQFGENSEEVYNDYFDDSAITLNRHMTINSDIWKETNAWTQNQPVDLVDSDGEEMTIEQYINTYEI